MKRTLLAAVSCFALTGAVAQSPVLLKDVLPNEDHSNPRFVTVHPDGRFLFAAVNDNAPLGPGVNSPQYSTYISDGTPAGTDAILSKGATWYQTQLGSRTVFAVDKLYITDGTGAGTIPLASPDGPYFVQGPLYTVGNKVFFAATDSLHGNELWVTDGTPAGTRLVKDIKPGTQWGIGNGTFDYNRRQALPQVSLDGQHIIFMAADSAWNVQFWTSDGTASGTQKVTSLGSSAGGLAPSPLFSGAGLPFYYIANDYLYFIFTSTSGISNSVDLWRTDGTTAGTSVVKQLSTTGGPGAFGGIDVERHFFAPVGAASSDRFIFSAPSDDGVELWSSDGTAVGTVMLHDIAPSYLSSYPTNFTPFDGKVLFSVYAGGTKVEAWITDGTVAGTQRLITLNRADQPGFPNASPQKLPREFTVLGNKAYFAAYDSTTGGELYVTDGTAAGTSLVADLQPGRAGSVPYGLTAARGNLFFSAEHPQHGRKLIRYNPLTAAFTVPQPAVINAPTAYGPSTYAIHRINDSTLFFGARYDSTVGYEPYALRVEQATSIAAASFVSAGFVVWPNPAHESVQVRVPGVPASLSLYNIAGQRVAQRTQLQPLENLPLRDLPADTYFLHIQDAAGQQGVQKVTVE